MTNPTLPALIEVAFGLTGVAPTNLPRTDLVTTFLTGITGLNQPQRVRPAEMLRLNTSIPPTPEAKQNRLGVVGAILSGDGDFAGFPNGRRPKDDVVDISLVAVMGGLCVANGDGNALGLRHELQAGKRAARRDVAQAARRGRPGGRAVAVGLPVPQHADPRRAVRESPCARALFLTMAAGAWLLVACGRDENTPLYANAATARAAVAAAAPPAPRFMPSFARSESPLSAADDEEPIDVSTLRLPQSEDAEPEPMK